MITPRNPTFTFVVCEVGHQFVASFDIESVTKIGDITNFLKERLTRHLQLKDLTQDQFFIMNDKMVPLDDSVQLQNTEHVTSKLLIQLRAEVKKSKGFERFRRPSHANAYSLNLQTIRQEPSFIVTEASDVTFRLVMSTKFGARTSVTIPYANIEFMNMLELEAMLLQDFHLQNQRLVFFDKSGVPFSTGLNVMQFLDTTLLGGLVKNRDVLVVATSNFNDIQNLKPRIPEDECQQYVYVTLTHSLKGEVDRVKTIRVNLAMHTLNDLLAFISHQFNEPSTRFAQIDWKDKQPTEHLLSNKTLQELKIGHTTYITIKLAYNSSEDPRKIQEFMKTRRTELTVHQTDVGQVQLISTLYVISKQYQKDTKLALIELIREITQNNAPLALALHTVLINQSKLHLTSRIALLQGIYGLIKDIFQAKNLFRSLQDYHHLFQHSRAIFSCLLKMIQQYNEIPQKWTNSFRFQMPDFYCQGQVIHQLIGLQMIHEHGASEEPQLWDLEIADQYIRQGYFRNTPEKIDLPLHRFMLALFLRLNKSHGFTFWSGEYQEEKSQNLGELFEFRSLQELKDQENYQYSLKIQTGSAFKGQQLPPKLVIHENQLKIFTNFVASSNRLLQLLNVRDIEASEVNIDEVNNNLGLNEEFKEQIKELDSGTADEAVVLLMDASNSMNETYQTGKNSNKLSKLQATQMFFHAFADKTITYKFNHLVQLVTFNRQITPFSNLIENFFQFKANVDRVKTSKYTKLYDALLHAIYTLQQYPRQIPKHIICLSDGLDTKSEASASDVFRKLHNSQIVVDAIVVERAGGAGFMKNLFGSPNKTISALKIITSHSRGYSFNPKTVQEGMKLFESETMLKLSKRKNYEQKRNNSQVFVPLDILLKAKQNYKFKEQPPEIKTPEVVLQGNCVTQSASLSLFKPEVQTTRGATNRMCVKRIYREIIILNSNPHSFFTIYPCEENIKFWKVIVQGPEDSPYSGFYFLLYIKFPNNYPYQAPELRFVTPIHHCNISKEGRICHPIFDRAYSIDVTIKDVFNHVYGLLLHPEYHDRVDHSYSREEFETIAKDQSQKHAFHSLNDISLKVREPPAIEEEKEP